MPGIDYEHIISNANKGPFSMNFNGTALDTYITNLVIEDVEGRDSLSSEVSEYVYTRNDGARFQYRRHEPKDLTVHYAVVSNSNTGQRSTLTTLRKILMGPGTENAKIIFADEPDKYWVGTVSNVTEEKIIYDNSSKGEITIRLSKPFKYATTETTVSPQTLNGQTIFAFNYDGSYKAFPTFTATFPTENVPAGSTLGNNGDCGYIAFMNQDGKVLQIGDPDETDLDSKSTNTTMINQKFTIWDANASRNWSSNTASGLGADYTVTGSVAKATMFDTDILTPSSYGSGDKWHGPSITYELPSADVTDFNMEFGVVFACGGNPATAVDIPEEEGVLRVILSNTTGTVAEMDIRKPYKSSINGKVTFKTTAGTEQYNSGIALGTYNSNFGWQKSGGSAPKRTCIIKRKGNTFTFTAGSITKSYTVTANAAYTNVKYVTFWFGKWGTDDPLGSIGLTSIKFNSDHWATNNDMKNKFGSNDVCVVDCEEAAIYLNNVDTPSLGAVGNNWEEFYLSPGANIIKVTWSSWVTNANKPTFSMKYRKVFL